MKIQKSELAKKIAMVQNVMPRRTTMDILQNILVDDGYMIANDSNMAIKVKLEGSEGQRFLLPQDTLPVISKLPDGEIEINVKEDKISIKSQSVSYEFVQQNGTEDFPLPAILEDAERGQLLDGEAFSSALNHVFFAIADDPFNRSMSSMLLKAFDEKVHVVGLDGKRVAWDQMEFIKSTEDFELKIPRETIAKLKSMKLEKGVCLRHDKLSAEFSTDDFELTTRLNDGKYFNFEVMFGKQEAGIKIRRSQLLSALERARLCGGSEPVIFDLSEWNIRISCRQYKNEYEEEVPLESMAPKPLLQMKIGFNPRLLIEALKAIEDETIYIHLSDGKSPIIITTSGESLKVLVLPVRLGGGN